MKAMALAAAALMFALTAACNDRDRDDVADRTDNAAEEVGAEVREGASDVGDATKDAANDVGDAAEDAADDVGNAAEDAAEDTREYSYARRNEFRRDVRARLDRFDDELAELERTTKEGADEARRDAVASAREARSAIGRQVERLGSASESNWDDLRRGVSDALDAAERELRALRPDAKPMGGLGSPS